MSQALSLRHQKVQRLRRLARRRTAREAERAFVAEGTKVLSEALAARVPIESVFAAPGADVDLLGRAQEAGVRVFDLAPGVMERVADTVTPQPVLAIMPFLDRPLEAMRDADWIVVLVDVRDPGNGGTVLRSAEAAGAGGVICCEGSVDVYNPKTVRASAGALFHVPVVSGGDPAAVLAQLGRWGRRRVGAVAVGGTAHTDADLTGPVALVLGNEAHGLPDHLVAVLDAQVTIPIRGRSESLNVGMAGAVLCFEIARQREAA